MRRNFVYSFSFLFCLALLYSLLVKYSKSAFINACLLPATNEAKDSIGYVEAKQSSLTSTSFLISASYENKICTFYLLTTKHTLDGIDNKENFTITIESSKKKRSYPVKLFKAFESKDLAIISFESSEKYPVLNLVRNKPNLNSDISIIGAIKCYPKIGGVLEKRPEQYRLQTTTGKIKDRKDIDKNRQRFYSLNKGEINNYETTKKSDLYYGNASVAGMSGAPILNKNGAVLGVQQITLIPQNSIYNCEEVPDNPESMGISIHKFLSEDIPVTVKDALSLVQSTD